MAVTDTYYVDPGKLGDARVYRVKDAREPTGDRTIAICKSVEIAESIADCFNGSNEETAYKLAFND